MTYKSPFSKHTTSIITHNRKIILDTQKNIFTTTHKMKIGNYFLIVNLLYLL